MFDGRPAFPQPGDELVVKPDPTPAGSLTPGSYPAGSRTVTVTLPNSTGDTSPVLLRRGGWLIDGTIDTASPFRRNFFAYRVTGFTDQGAGAAANTTKFDVDLETPLKADLNDGVTANASGVTLPASQIYFLAGLTEVFTRPALRPDANY